jgi:hypothetical protein
VAQTSDISELCLVHEEGPFEDDGDTCSEQFVSHCKLHGKGRGSDCRRSAEVIH